MTDSERRRRVEEVCDAALNRDARERAAFVAAACGGDEALRQEVEALLAHAQTAEGFLAAPIGAVAAHVLGDQPGASFVGTQVGAYHIVSHLGAGGMGEVYRARDTRLGRDVAIKILPRAFTTDPERLARFEREARMLASLNHPNIATIYGIEERDGIHALVLELVEGETLDQRLEAGSGGAGRGRIQPLVPSLKPPRGLPIGEVLTIARQIAAALEAAHEQGIIHRDLKPANIKITPAGDVKVLDFGLAKLQAIDGSTPDLTQSPTVTVGGTREGVIMGTAAYMSPEQARGKPVDKRTDIWAFGCVLYEMLTGKRVFESNDVSDTLAAILRGEPDWSALPGSTPAAIRRLLLRCLEKDPRERLHDISDARLEIKEVLAAPASTKGDAALAAPRPRRERVSWVALAVAVAVIAALAIPATLYLRRPAPEPLVTRLDVVTPPTNDPFSFALSPDGRQLVFAANGGKGSQLWLRPLDQATAQPIAGTENGTFPFWSPDGRAIGFFADAKLKRLDLAGGAPQVLADAGPGGGGAWNRDGVIVFSTQAGLMRVAATGGTPAEVIRLSATVGSRGPQFLPDGRRFLFYVGLGPLETVGMYVGSLDGGEPTRVLATDTTARYAPPGYLLQVSRGVLVARRFAPARAAVSGEPIPLAESVEMSAVRQQGLGGFSVSDAGVLAYRSGTGSRRQLVWVDRSGKTLSVLGPPDDAGLSRPELAPDGQRVAVFRSVQGNGDVWLMEVGRGIASRFTFDPAADAAPIWSPDGSRIVFRSQRNGHADLFEKPANGANDEQPLLVTAQDKSSQDWSPDGHIVLYAVLDPKTQSDLWALPLVGERKPFPVVRTGFDEVQGRFSPDGRWLAYTSNESGRYEVYVRPFPEPGGKWQVSAGGGIYPRWRRDGKELFYLAPDSRLMAVPVEVAANGAVTPGTPSPLFITRMAVGGNTGIGGISSAAQYAVAPDGRFLLNVIADDAGLSPITIVQNWPTLLKK